MKCYFFFVYCICYGKKKKKIKNYERWESVIYKTFYYTVTLYGYSIYLYRCFYIKNIVWGFNRVEMEESVLKSYIGILVWYVSSFFEACFQFTMSLITGMGKFLTDFHVNQRNKSVHLNMKTELLSKWN